MVKEARHYGKIVITLSLCLAILFIATFSPFAESANAVAVVDDAIIAIIIAGLAAVGITFATTGAFDTLEEYVGSLFGEFAQYQGTTVDSLTSGLQSGTNKLGQILINNRFVLLIDTFARWLINKFSLTNNSRVQAVVPGSTLNGMLVYETPFTFPSNNPNAYSTIVYSDDGTPVNALISQNDNIGFYIYFFSDHQTGINVTYIYHNQPTSYHYDLQSYDPLYPNCKYYTYRAGTIYDYVNTSAYTKYPNQQIRDALNADYNVIVNDTGIVINTDNMVLPTDDSNYTEGDGAIIDVGADWGDTYTDVIDDTIPDAFSDENVGDASITYEGEETIAEEVESTSEITNLPAGTIPFTPMQLPQFHLVDIWHYVADWISDTAIAAGALMAIVVQEPHPMVNLFYATVCLAIIFGIIKGVAK